MRPSITTENIVDSFVSWGKNLVVFLFLVILAFLAGWVIGHGLIYSHV